MSSLYLDHFGLSKPPFQITPDLDFFFSGGRRGDILSALLHVAAHDEGIITLVAEVGSGKTLLARLMINRLGPEVCAVYLANPCFSRDEIIVAIARDLGLTGLDGTIEGKLAALQQELLRRHATGQRVLLVIDEAHAMPVESLEEVRLLSNLETGQHKLVNIMLFGQPELDDLLADRRLRQVRDRVIHRFELQPLQGEEASAYIDHRLRAAGWHGGRLFSAAALTRLVKASDGRARRINLLADKALLAAYAQGESTVEVRHVNNAVQELPISRMTPTVTRSDRWRLAGWSIALAAVMTAGVIGLFAWYRGAAPAVASAVPDRPPVAVSPDAPARIAAAAGTVASLPPLVDVPASAPVSGTTGPETVSANMPAPASDSSPPPGLPPIEPLDMRLDVVLARTQFWLQQENRDGYTIQLAALHTANSPDRYLGLVATQFGALKTYAKYSNYNGKTYISVYAGHFESLHAAALAIEALPPVMKTNRPLVRSWVKIKQEQTP